MSSFLSRERVQVNKNKEKQTKSVALYFSEGGVQQIYFKMPLPHLPSDKEL